MCFALQRARCATVKGGLNVHPTCLSTSALLTAGNVAAPATDPCPGWSPNAALLPPELAHGQPGTQPLPLHPPPPAYVSTTNDGGSRPSARSTLCPCKFRNGRCVTCYCTELPSFYGGAL